MEEITEKRLAMMYHQSQSQSQDYTSYDLRSALVAVMQELKELRNAVNMLASNHVTREDLKQAQREIQATFFSKDALEPRLIAMAEHINRLEKDIGSIIVNVDAREEKKLSGTDRLWVRLSIFGGVASIVVSGIVALLGHIHFN